LEPQGWKRGRAFVVLTAAQENAIHGNQICIGPIVSIRTLRPFSADLLKKVIGKKA
jgi:hypothetical protein